MFLQTCLSGLYKRTAGFSGKLANKTWYQRNVTRKQKTLSRCGLAHNVTIHCKYQKKMTSFMFTGGLQWFFQVFLKRWTKMNIVKQKLLKRKTGKSNNSRIDKPMKSTFCTVFQIKHVQITTAKQQFWTLPITKRNDASEKLAPHPYRIIVHL